MRNSVLVYFARAESLMVDSAAVWGLAGLCSMVRCVCRGTIGAAGAPVAGRNLVHGLVPREPAGLAPGFRQA